MRWVSESEGNVCRNSEGMDWVKNFLGIQPLGVVGLQKCVLSVAIVMYSEQAGMTLYKCKCNLKQVFRISTN